MDSKLEPGQAPAALGPPPGAPPPDDEGERPSGDDRKKSSRRERSRSRSRERRRSRSLRAPHIPRRGAARACAACASLRIRLRRPTCGLRLAGRVRGAPPRANPWANPRCGGAGRGTGGARTTGTGSTTLEEAGGGTTMTGEVGRLAVRAVAASCARSCCVVPAPVAHAVLSRALTALASPRPRGRQAGVRATPTTTSSSRRVAAAAAAVVTGCVAYCLGQGPSGRECPFRACAGPSLAWGWPPADLRDRMLVPPHRKRRKSRPQTTRRASIATCARSSSRRC